MRHRASFQHVLVLADHDVGDELAGQAEPLEGLRGVRGEQHEPAPACRHLRCHALDGGGQADVIRAQPGRRRQRRHPAHPAHDLRPLVGGPGVDGEHDVARAERPADTVDGGERPPLDAAGPVRPRRHHRGDDDERRRHPDHRGPDPAPAGGHRPPQHHVEPDDDEHDDERQGDEQPPVRPRVVRRDARPQQREQGRAGGDDEGGHPRLDDPARRRPDAAPHDERQHHEGDDERDDAHVPGEPADRLLGVGAPAVDGQPLPGLHAGDVARPRVVRVLARDLPQRPAGEVQPGEHDTGRGDVGQPAQHRRRQPCTAPPQQQCRPRATPDEDEEHEQGHEARADRGQVLPRQPHRRDRRHHQRGGEPDEARTHPPPAEGRAEREHRQEQHHLAQRVDPHEPGPAEEQPRDQPGPGRRVMTHQRAERGATEHHPLRRRVTDEAGPTPGCRPPGIHRPGGREGQREQPAGQGQHRQRLGVRRPRGVQHREEDAGARRRRDARPRLDDPGDEQAEGQQREAHRRAPAARA